MVPDITQPQKRQQQANSVDSSASPSPLTTDNSSASGSTINSPATPSSFSPTPSPESNESSTSSGPGSSYQFTPNYHNVLPSATATTSSHNDSFSSHQLNRSQQGQVALNGFRNGFNSTHNYPNSTAPSSSSATTSNGNTQQPQLPIHYVKNQLMKNIQSHQSIIIIGETGCGKTTQIPKFIYEFYGSNHHDGGRLPPFTGLIGITQPRRVAAVSIATRVAHEMNSMVGGLVGYTIRFENTTSPATRIKYMTDGILLREAITDPTLSKYRVIILDEAHERTVHTDVLFGVVKKAQRIRANLKRALDASEPNNSNQQSAKNPLRPLKLIIMSATMDVDHFSRYFNDAPVYYIEGRPHPIEIFYTQERQSDYVTAALATIFQIHQQEDELDDETAPKSNTSTSNGFSHKKRVTIGGDIIVFCTGQEEIESMIKTVMDLAPQLSGFKTRSGISKTLKPYPLYAALPSAKQQQIFTRPADDCFRRVIFATNIAETSITVPNIRFVIDTGKVKSRIFSPGTGFEVMKVEDISRAQACQRSGRAGRLAPGVCYRLYTKKDYKKMRRFPIPDIQKCNLSNILLQLMAVGVKDVVGFDYVDPPCKENIDASLEALLNLKAIERLLTPNTTTSPPTDLYHLTELGKQMVTFPVDPRFSALIIASKSFRCTDEVLAIIAMLSVDTVFYIPASEREQALKMHRKFASSEGDLIKLLNVYRRYREAKQSREWCNENYLRPVQLKMAVEIRTQLAELCKKLSIPIPSAGAAQTEQLRKCLAVSAGVGVGLGANVAILQREGDYRVLEFPNRRILTKPSATSMDSSSRTVYIHPSSCLFSGSVKPECLLFTELVHTTKSYMRNVCIIDPQWLIDYKDPPQDTPHSQQSQPSQSLNADH